MDNGLFIVNTLYNFKDRGNNDVLLCTTNHQSVREFMSWSENGNYVIEKGNVIRITEPDNSYKSYIMDYIKILLYESPMAMDNAIPYSSEVFVALKQVE